MRKARFGGHRGRAVREGYGWCRSAARRCRTPMSSPIPSTGSIVSKICGSPWYRGRNAEHQRDLSGAFLYENEIHDLFGVVITHISIDYQGTLYRTAISTPFSVEQCQAAGAAAAEGGRHRWKRRKPPRDRPIPPSTRSKSAVDRGAALWRKKYSSLSVPSIRCCPSQFTSTW